MRAATLGGPGLGPPVRPGAAAEPCFWSFVSSVSWSRRPQGSALRSARGRRQRVSNAGASLSLHRLSRWREAGMSGCPSSALDRVRIILSVSIGSTADHSERLPRGPLSAARPKSFQSPRMHKAVSSALARPVRARGRGRLGKGGGQTRGRGGLRARARRGMPMPAERPILGLRKVAQLGPGVAVFGPGLRAVLFRRAARVWPRAQLQSTTNGCTAEPLMTGPTLILRQLDAVHRWRRHAIVAIGATDRCRY